MANEGQGRFPEQARCPKCGQTADGDGNIAQRLPGTIAICLSCGAALIVSDDYTIRATVPEDFDGFDPYEVVRFAQVRRRVQRRVDARKAS